MMSNFSETLIFYSYWQLKGHDFPLYLIHKPGRRMRAWELIGNGWRRNLEFTADSQNCSPVRWESWIIYKAGCLFRRVFSTLVTSLGSMMSRDCTLSSSGEVHLGWEFARNTNNQASPQAVLANKITWWLPGWCMAWVHQLTLLLMLRVTCYLLHYITRGRRL